MVDFPLKYDTKPDCLHFNLSEF